MRIKGIERRKKLSDEIKQFPLMVKVMRGEVEKDKRKRTGKENNPNA